MEVHTLVCGPIETNTYIVTNGGTDCVVIDPADANPVRAYCAEHGLTPAHVLVTHGHFDHILGVAALKDMGAKVYVQTLGAEALHSNHASLAVMGGISVPHCEADVLLSDKDVIHALGLDIDVMYTPGHSSDSVSYIIKSERTLFDGDLLFRLSVGRSDLPGANAKQLFDSIQFGLFALEGDYTVYPGHMRPTTLEFERQHNPFMKRWDASIW